MYVYNQWSHSHKVFPCRRVTWALYTPHAPSHAYALPQHQFLFLTGIRIQCDVGYWGLGLWRSARMKSTQLNKYNGDGNGIFKKLKGGLE